MTRHTEHVALPASPDPPAAAALRREPSPPHEQDGLRLLHRVYNTFDAAGGLRRDWDRLAVAHGDLFSSYDWCRTWWDSYGHGRRLEIHALHVGEEMVAVLPLFRQTLPLGGAFLRTVRLVGCDHTLDAAGLAIHPEHVEPVLRHLLDDLDAGGEWDLLHFGPLRHYAQASEAIRDAAGAHPRVQAVIHGACDNWITQFDLPETYEAYLGGLSRDDRRNVVRRERNLQGEHGVQAVVARDGEQVRHGMDALVRLHGQLWAGKGHQGVFGNWPDYESFHRAVAECFAAKGQLALAYLEGGDGVIGVTYGYHFGPRTHAMITGYIDDPPWRSFGLGRLLHCLITREAIEHGSKGIDDGRGVFEHKLRFGGRLEGERSVAILRRGRLSRLRFWLAMRAAYLLHVAYSRIWYDRLAPRLGRRRPLRRFYVHSSFLAQLFRRVRFGLGGGPAVQEADRLAPPAELPAAAQGAS